jgi:hypothetical protein
LFSTIDPGRHCSIGTDCHTKQPEERIQAIAPVEFVIASGNDEVVKIALAIERLNL